MKKPKSISGAKGGNATLKKYGKEHMKKIAQLPRKKKIEIIPVPK